MKKLEHPKPIDIIGLYDISATKGGEFGFYDSNERLIFKIHPIMLKELEAAIAYYKQEEMPSDV